MSRQMKIGGVTIGGGAEVAIQSMCNTRTEDVTATVAQILRLERSGCQIIRVAVPTMEAAAAIAVYDLILSNTQTSRRKETWI